jgi:CHRD domain-containing protein
MHRRSIAMLFATGTLLMSLASAPPAYATQRFTTSLSGAAERPGPGDPNASGTASITINRGLGEVCWSISVADILLPAAAAHIHEAPVGVPGPVVVTLGPPGTDGISTGCTTADRALVKEIAKNPTAFYVNVHNSEFPDGALRGQLG